MFCSVFIVGKQQSCAVGALAICTDLVAQEVTNPAESAFTCPGASPGSSQVLCPLLLPCSQQTCPTCLFLPHGRGWMEPAMGCGICKTCGPFPGSCETNLHAPCLPSCPLNAAYFSPPFFPPFCLCFCWRKLPILGVRGNAENEVKKAKISQGRFFRADPPLGPMSVICACSTQLHHAVRKRDLKSNLCMYLFLLLPWIENPLQGRSVNPSLGGWLC